MAPLGPRIWGHLLKASAIEETQVLPERPPKAKGDVPLQPSNLPLAELAQRPVSKEAWEM